MNKNNKKSWWLEGLAILFAIHGFVACGKSGGGGPQLIGPGLSGFSNNCNFAGCFGVSAGQQIARAQGSVFHDDELDGESTKAQNRLMDLALTVNVWQQNTNGMYGSPVGQPFINSNPMLYNGFVHVSGQLTVAAPILGCNIPQGNYTVQPQSTGVLNSGMLTVVLGVNVNGGQGFTIQVEGLNLLPGNIINTGGLNNINGMGNSRLVGVIKIPNCNDTTFRVE